MAKQELSDPITLRIPVELLSRIEAVGEATERTRSWVIVRALRLYMAGEGQDLLAIAEGRRQVTSGEAHDMDDVLTELDEIIAGRAAQSR